MRLGEVQFWAISLPESVIYSKKSSTVGIALICRDLPTLEWGNPYTSVHLARLGSDGPPLALCRSLPAVEEVILMINMYYLVFGLVHNGNRIVFKLLLTVFALVPIVTFSLDIDARAMPTKLEYDEPWVPPVEPPVTGGGDGSAPQAPVNDGGSGGGAGEGTPQHIPPDPFRHEPLPPTLPISGPTYWDRERLNLEQENFRKLEIELRSREARPRRSGS